MTPLEIVVEKARAGQLVLLLGPDAPRELTGRPSAAELALQRSGQRSLAAAADAEPPFVLLPFLRQQLASQAPPGPLHRALVTLPVPYLLAATWDDGWPQALAAAGKPFNLLVQDSDLSQRTFNRPDLICLCGELARPATLALKSQKYAELLLDNQRVKLFGRVSGWLNNKLALIVGCNPAEDGDFERLLWREVLRFRGGFGGGALLLWPGAAMGDEGRWAGRNVAILDADPLAFLDDLAAELAAEPITLPPDEDMAKLQGLMQLFLGAPDETAVNQAAVAVPADQRLRSIRASLALSLDGDIVQSRFSVGYDPDIFSFDETAFHNTGIAVAQLGEWAKAAARRRRRFESPVGTEVETSGAAFLAAMLPEGSDARRQLANALFLEQTFAEPAALRIVIDLEQDAGYRLAPYPWELLHAGQVNWEGKINGRGFLGLEYPVYRRVNVVASPARIAARLKKALVVAADPTDQLENLEQEAAWLATEALAKAGLQVDVIPPDDPLVSSPSDLAQRIRDGGYQLLHFAGHGEFHAEDPKSSRIVLGRSGEGEIFLTAEALAEVARNSELALVFLSACEIGDTAALDEQRPWDEGGVVNALAGNGVPATIGMRWKVADGNARKLVQGFYSQLLNGKAIERALQEACAALRDTPDWVNPILTKRHGALG